MRSLIAGVIFILMAPDTLAQLSLEGTVKYLDNNKEEPVAQAMIGWVGTRISALTDINGKFKITRPENAFELYILSYGFKGDTITIRMGQSYIDVFLKPDAIVLDEIVVRDRESATTIQNSSVQLTELITERELTKAACCNLSESFETNPAIDASFTDAVTGARQIRLLGLDGPYSLYTRGNIPTLGGLASIMGLQFVPGSWIQSIQLTKGSGSVVNGFESVAGQVNYELRQPDAKEKIYVQLYANEGGRFEQSVVLGEKINEQLSTNVMLYGRQQYFNPDFNHDGFLDMPQGPLWIAQNTWKYRSKSGWESHGGVFIANSRLSGGQSEEVHSAHLDSLWRNKLETDRIEVWNKTGYVFQNKPFASLGLQLSYTYNKQVSDFGIAGTQTYNGTENTFYVNLIYQDILGNSNHQYKTGLSLKYQKIDEIFQTLPYSRVEQIPGVFVEYSWLASDKITAVAGLRADYHNIYGNFYTPRFHLRYAPAINHVVRLNAGKAYRTPNLFADHMGAMASNRMWLIAESDNSLPYNGIQQEESYNAGISYTYNFKLDYRNGSFRAEYFYTGFNNQLVKDWDYSSREVHFYNLEGKSYAHSAQIQLDYELIQRLEMRLAYRFVDAKTEYRSIGLTANPFIARNRYFINLAYETRSYWKFDFTLSTLGEQRIPFTGDNQPGNIRSNSSETFSTVNIQVSKIFKEVLEVHVGMENALDFMQPDAIISPDNPFSPEFDASMIWGPIMGRMIYTGIRWRFLR